MVRAVYIGYIFIIQYGILTLSNYFQSTSYLDACLWYTYVQTYQTIDRVTLVFSIIVAIYCITEYGHDEDQSIFFIFSWI